MSLQAVQQPSLGEQGSAEDQRSARPRKPAKKTRKVFAVGALALLPALSVTACETPDCHFNIWPPGIECYF